MYWHVSKIYLLADVYGAGTYDCGEYSTAQTLSIRPDGSCGVVNKPLVNTGTALLIPITIAVTIMFITSLLHVLRRPKRNLNKE